MDFYLGSDGPRAALILASIWLWISKPRRPPTGRLPWPIPVEFCTNNSAVRLPSTSILLITISRQRQANGGKSTGQLPWHNRTRESILQPDVTGAKGFKTQLVFPPTMRVLSTGPCFFPRKGESGGHRDLASTNSIGGCAVTVLL